MTTFPTSWARFASSAVVRSVLALGLCCPRIPRANAEPLGTQLSAPEPSHNRLEVTRLFAPGSLMVRIAAGPAVVGSTWEEVLRAAASCAGEALAHACSERTFANELGRRVLGLPSFYIDRTEVTTEDYRRCVDAGRCRPASYAAGGLRFDRPGLPRTFVSYYEARDYCRFRGARLPSEVEFERAARGPGGRNYPWGNLYNTRVSNHGRFALFPNDPSDGYAELAPVGAFPAGRTPDGALDLAGNVAEWQEDAYRERYDDPVPEPTAETRRVVRGGSFLAGAAWLRGAARQSAMPETRRPDLGFRCARSLEPGVKQSDGSGQ